MVELRDVTRYPGSSPLSLECLLVLLSWPCHFKGHRIFFFFLENHIVLNLFDVSCDSVLITYFFLPKQDLRNCRLSLHLLCSWGGRPWSAHSPLSSSFLLGLQAGVTMAWFIPRWWESSSGLWMVRALYQVGPSSDSGSVFIVTVMYFP